MDDDPWAQAPSSEQPGSSASRALRLPVVAVVVALFVIGACVSVALPFYWEASGPAPAVIVRPPWNPGTGPLVQGLRLDDGMPDQIAWSPDAKQVAWTTFDDSRSESVVWLVGVGEAGFTAKQQLDAGPSFMDVPAPAVVEARIEDELVALRWADGPARGQIAGVVDLPGLLGLVDARAPAVVTFGPTTWLAVAARLPEESASPTLHVFDVSDLISRPTPQP